MNVFKYEVALDFDLCLGLLMAQANNKFFIDFFWQLIR